MKEKNVLYVILKEALTGAGCPICKLLHKRKEEWIESLLYELAGDAYVRKRIRERGFCAHHLWNILGYVKDHLGLGSLTTSIILHDLLSSVISSLEKGEKMQQLNSCVLCELLRKRKEIYIDSLAEWIEEPELFNLFQIGEPMFCLPHLVALLEKMSPEMSSKILSIQLEKMRTVNDKLRSLIRKSDYIVEEKITAEEAEAKKAAVEALKGKDL